MICHFTYRNWEGERCALPSIISTLRIALHPAIEPFAPEAKYALRTLLRLAGYGQHFEWANAADSEGADIYYGPDDWQGSAAYRIAWCGKPLTDAEALEPRGLRNQDGLAFLDFGQASSGLHRTGNGQVHFASDIVLASFWLLTGARERHYRRDAYDNFHLDGSALLSSGALQQPLVSLYAAFLRRHFAEQGKPPAALPWAGPDGIGAAFVFSHDVDYPEMIRAIEFLRVLGGRTHASRRALAGVLTGANHFWRFADWVELARRYGARPAFYFSARRGSLAQYAAGTPDCFYDIRSPRFRELFRYLRDEGCEVGLHASYHAFKDAQQLRREKASLEEAAGVRVEGGRHHYWRLNPEAPHETLAHHQQMGMTYDSSLAYEFYPGFRRGVCHPFRPFDPRTRSELEIIELPPTWMDDHFDRRLAKNGIADPSAPEAEVTERTSAHARRLLDAVRSTGGVAVVDYHVRGMNPDFFPRYGPWLTRFAAQHFDSSWRFATPCDLAREHADYERAIEAASADSTGVERRPAEVAHTADTKPEQCTVGLLRPEEERAWDAFVEAHRDTTIYHTIAWKRVTEEGLGHRSKYLRALDAAGEIIGVLPLFEVDAFGGRVLVSVPLRDKGGPLTRSAAAAAKLVAASVDTARSTGAKSITIRYPPEGQASHLLAAGFAEQRHWVTTVVPVAMGEEKLWNDVFRSPTRRAVNKARNSGLVPRWASSEADLAKFYRVFLLTRRKLGVPPYPFAFFQAIWRHLYPQQRARLLLVEREGAVQGALMVFPYQREVVSAYLGSDPKVKDLRVNDLLFWEAIRWSAGAGYDDFHFGADSPLQEGLLAYKRKWGGRQFAIPNFTYSMNSGPHRAVDSSDPRYARYRRVISHIPMPLFRALGSMAARRLW